MNFQMYKLDLEKAKESEIKLPTFTGSSKKLDNSRKTSISASLTTLKPLTVWNTTNCGKCLKRWEYQTTLPASGETSMQVTMQQFRTRHGTTEWFKTGKGVCQGCILPPCLFNCSAQHNMQNARLGEPQAGIKMARRNINNFRYAGNTTLMAESKEELKSFLMKIKEESKKAGLKLNIQRGEDNPLQYACLENPHGQRSMTGCSPWGHKESDTMSDSAQLSGNQNTFQAYLCISSAPTIESIISPWNLSSFH